MQEEKGFLTRQKEEWRSFIFRALAPPVGAPRVGLASFPPLSVLEGMSALLGSLAELMPEEQPTLAGILRIWAGLFVVCGFGLMVVGGVLGP